MDMRIGTAQEVPTPFGDRNEGNGGMWVSPESFAAAILVVLVTGICVGRCSRSARTTHSTNELEDLNDLAYSDPASLDFPAGREPDYAFSGGEYSEITGTHFCPVCLGEYLSDAVTCDDCGVDLVDEDDVPETEIRIQEGTVRVARLPRAFHGQLVKEFLDSNRIPCAVLRSSAWEVLGADIYVFESDAVRAKRLIRHFFTDLNVSVA